MTGEKVKIPAPFIHPPFFKDDTVSIKDEFPFSAEILHINGICEGSPWQDSKRAVLELINRWDMERVNIAALFRDKRKREAKSQMIIWASRYLQALFWMNDQPVPGVSNLDREIPELHHKPVNAPERILFILESPGHYHSFIQLTQLFDEAKKLFHKKLALQ